MLFTVLRSVIRLPSALSILILTGTPSISPVIITCLSPAMYCMKTGSFTARSIIIEACAGGHTIQDDTPKYGLSVTGFVDPRKFWKNFGAQTGDKLILTKALGAGIVNTAIKADLVTEGARKAVLASMKKLNRDACEVLKKFEVHACTDVTGFGLGGHATEMAVASDRTVVIDTEKLPVLPDVKEFASMGLIPGGAYRNREFAEKTGVKSSAVLWREDLVFDPQTSGGLLAAVPERDVPEIMKRLDAAGLQAGVIGEVVDRREWTLEIR